MNLVIAVDKGKQRPPGRLNAPVPRRSGPGVFLLQHDYSAVLRRVFMQNGRRTIRRTVIDAQYLEIFVCLADEAIQATREVRLGIIYGNDDGYAWSCG